MAPAYKLTYYPSECLGESIRFLFHYGGIEFEDIRFDRADWPKIKPTMPFGQVPILEHNGKVVNQSVAIARYVAKQVKLTGNNDWENLEIDAIVDTITDLRIHILRYDREPNETIRKQLKDTLLKETVPYYLQRFEDIVKDNNGHLALGRLTWADLFFASIMKYLCYMLETDIFVNYSNLLALRDSVHEIPAIKAWVARRPPNEQ